MRRSGEYAGESANDDECSVCNAGDAAGDPGYPPLRIDGPAALGAVAKSASCTRGPDVRYQAAFAYGSAPIGPPWNMHRSGAKPKIVGDEQLKRDADIPRPIGGQAGAEAP